MQEMKCLTLKTSWGRTRRLPDRTFMYILCALIRGASMASR
uniref:Uncharacterized protein n=1 Tax=Anguilla anguilla TaxID=7936 RepID=A0A0E9UF04_ANGAN